VPAKQHSEAHPASGHLLKAAAAFEEAGRHANRAAEMHGAGEHDKAAHHAYLARGYFEQADLHLKNAAAVHLSHPSAIKIAS
jgi:Flp pilus assembly protein TadD